MQFQIIDIQFDCESDIWEECSNTPKEDQKDVEDTLQKEYIGQIWEADDEDDLIEEITCASGWCIKSIDYRHILK